jgi:hypothetical protein
MENQKFNIPKKHSLDSMEGVEETNNPESAISDHLEISPEIEKMVMRKVKDIFESGTGYHSARRVFDYFRPNWDFDDGYQAPVFEKRIKENKKELGRFVTSYDSKGKIIVWFEEVTEETIDDYFINESIADDDIENLFLHGIFYNKEKERDKDGKMVLPISYKGYKKHIKDIEKSITRPVKQGEDYGYRGKVWFNMGGRVKKGNTEALNEWVDQGAFTLVFNPPKDEKFILKKDDKGFFHDLILKKGQYSTSHYNTNGSIALSRLLEKYSDLKPNDPRIIEEVIKEKKEIQESGEEKEWGKIYISDYFNEKGETLIGGEGFILPYRIPSRDYQGVVINRFDRMVFLGDVVEENESSSIDKKELFKRFKEFNDKLLKGDHDAIQKHFNNYVKKIVKIMIHVHKDNPQKMIPIYDNIGNLLWPKKMTNEEIVKMKTEEKAQDTQD